VPDEPLRELLAPVRAGRLSLRNRVVMPAHTTNFAVDGRFSDQHLAYHRERAAGGVALIVTEGMRVHPTSLGRTNTVAAFDDGIIDSLARLVEVVHAEGALLAAQVLHVGRQAGGHSSLTPAWGASAIPWSSSAATPHAMSATEIAEVVRGFGAAARRAAQAGVDAVEVHLGHGHLLQQFLSPVSNRRSDGYGGDLTGRLRITREALDAVRSEVSGDLPLMLRISGDEFLEGGLGVPEMIEAVGLLLADYSVDVLDVSHSAYVASGSVATQIADMSFEPQPFREIPRAFRAAFPQTPVIAVCRLDTLEAAADLIRAGDADLVALARPHIATPDLVRRAERRLRGEYQPAQDCIACNQACAGRLELGLPISCVVNPEAGREREWAALRSAANSPTGSPRRRILVVGGGPAGLHAAVAAAEAGQQVVLRDAGVELGGALLLASRQRGRSSFARMVDQLAERATHLGVELELERPVVDSDLVEGWDAIVLATGGIDEPTDQDVALGAVPLAGLVHAPARAGAHAVVIDDDGSWTTLSLVESLVAAGCRVTLLCAQPALFWRVPVYSKPAHLARLRDDAFSVRLLTEALHRDGADVVCRDVFGGREQRVTAVDTVTVVRARVARTDLADALERRGIPHTVVGDAFAPRTALEAAFEGRRAGLTAALPHREDARAAMMSLGALL
jgi:2,4-dienoyl-CoA reductase-like NADH-dependent reductase (Old Yellow Enzyme family)